MEVKEEEYKGFQEWKKKKDGKQDLEIEKPREKHLEDMLAEETEEEEIEEKEECLCGECNQNGIETKVVEGQQLCKEGHVLQWQT